MKTYSNGTYTVTINSDRSIKVKSGDWISKYSAAIWNDPHANWDLYKRKVNGNFVNIDNPNALNVGETIYFIGELPAWPGSPPPMGVPPTPPTNGTGEPTPDSVTRYMNWILRTLCPVSQWSVVGSNDLGGGAVVQAQACQVGLQHVDENAARWFSGLCIGAGVGPAAVKAGATWSATWLSNGIEQVSGLSGLSFVAKSPVAGSELSAREFSGSFLRFDIGGSLLVGGAGSVLAVGCKTPVEFAVRKAMEMAGGHAEFSWVPIAPMALIFLSGVNLGFDCGASVKGGQMWETSGWTGNYL